MAFKRKVGKKFKKSYKRKGHRASNKTRGFTSFAKKVMKVIKRAAEHKHKSFTTQSVVTSGAGVFGLQVDCGMTNASLAISQGTGQGDRIGNKIKIVKAEFRYVITPYPYNATLNTFPQPQDIRMIWSRAKPNPQAAPAAATFFQNGDSSAAPSGYTLDMIEPINTDLNTVYKQKRHKVGPAIIATASGGLAAPFYGANNDYKLNVISKVDMTKFFPKTIDYSDAVTSSTTPTVYLSLLTCEADSTLSTSAYNSILNYTIDITYEDF